MQSTENPLRVSIVYFWSVRFLSIAWYALGKTVRFFLTLTPETRLNPHQSTQAETITIHQNVYAIHFPLPFILIVFPLLMAYQHCSL